jgi:hypothetical protein
MRLDDYRTSDNVEDQRGKGGRRMAGLPFGGGKMGIGMLAVIVIGAMLLGVDPSALLNGGMTGQAPPQQSAGPAGSADPASAADACNVDPISRFSCQVLASTEDSWEAIFRAQGAAYTPPRFVFYAGTGMSGCGSANAAVGPFYCPADQRIYLDTSFFDELHRRFGAPGDFAQAYVIAHEVGHHIQTVTGISEQVRSQQSQVGEREGNALQVRMELQADCYAGVWGARNRDRIEAGDIDEALGAARAIGDDTLQRQAQGRVVPDSFTHGSAEQRMRWFKQGYDTGDPGQCDTFAARQI